MRKKPTPPRSAASHRRTSHTSPPGHTPTPARSPDSFLDALDEADTLLDRGEFAGAAETLTPLVEQGTAHAAAVDAAYAAFALACCLDRLGRTAEADSLFRTAAALDPEEFTVPPRLQRDAFEGIVDDALHSLPENFRPLIAQVRVSVRDYPGEESPDPFCLGLYLGLPRTERTIEERDHLDDVLIYQRTHEIEFPDGEMLEQVRKTVIHEIGHHFGLREDEMGDYA